MNQIKEKLKKITDIWNDYVLDLNFFQRKINFTDEVQTNYYGDILRYFDDTFDSLKIRKTKSYQNHVFNMIGLLQVIYIQQDLTDELLYIFKLQQSSVADKNPNRELRNELIGHPIRRRKHPANELISSVFFGRDLSPNMIHYILYSKKNDFRGESTFYSTIEIIKNHKTFLNTHFDRILKKLDVLLGAYKEKIAVLQTMISQRAAFPKIVSFVCINYEKIMEDNYLYKKEILLACYERNDEHPRYQFVTDLFVATLNRYLQETNDYIDALLKRSYTFSKKKKFPVVKISIRSASNSLLSQKQNNANYLNYELSKLHGRKHPIYSIDYFKGQFVGNAKILAELANMENNINNNLEYYSSYEYLKLLLDKQDK